MGFVKGLKCRECGREYPVKLLAGCEDCFGPIEVDYDYDAIARILNRDVIETGVGVARSSAGGLYYCQVFGRQQSSL